jgi:hypothetical protein
MNVLLLCVVLPLFLALLVYDACIVYHFYRLGVKASRVAWGGLQGNLFYAFVVTFLLSGFGCTSTFVLYASLETPETSSIFLFVVMNASYLAFNYALMHNKQDLVLVCLWTNILVFTTLFVYTIVVFDPRADLDNERLIVATHVCNFVAIFHVVVMDLVVWYTGWIEARAEYEPSLKTFPIYT